MATVKRPVTALPAETLLEIFQYLAIQERVAVRAVCRAWRAVSTACPVIVTEDVCLETDQLRCYLDQMRGAPLLYDSCIDIYNFSDSAAALASTVAAHMDRTVILDLQIICGSPIPEELRVAVAQPAPLLERVRLEFDMGMSTDDLVLFGHCAPRLVYCSVYTCGDIIPAIALFKTLRVIVLLGLVLYSDVEPLFTEFPVLEELALCVSVMDHESEDEEDQDQRPTPPPALQPPPSLKHLTITSEASDIPDLTRFFAWIEHESINIVSIRHHKESWRDDGKPRPDMVQRMLDLLALPGVGSLVVSCAPKECGLRLIGADGRERLHAGLYRETLAGLLRAAPLSTLVTDLVLAGVHALYKPDLVPSLNHFTTLRSFTLILRRLSPESESFSTSLCIPPIYCPSLESVTLAITQSDYKRVETVPLTAKDIREFLRDKLREDLRGTLKRLCLRGVSVDDVSGLQPFVHEIYERPYDPLTNFVYPEDRIRQFDHDDLYAD